MMDGTGPVRDSAGLALTGTFFSTTLSLYIFMNHKDIKESEYLRLPPPRDCRQVKPSNCEAESSTSLPFSSMALLQGRAGETAAFLNSSDIR